MKVPGPWDEESGADFFLYLRNILTDMEKSLNSLILVNFANLLNKKVRQN